MVPIDSKGRTILKEDDASIVAMFLAQVRGTLHSEKGVSQQDWLDTRQVLVALAKAGWAIVPQSKLDGWRKGLNETTEVVDGSYLETVVVTSSEESG